MHVCFIAILNILNLFKKMISIIPALLGFISKTQNTSHNVSYYNDNNNNNRLA